MEMKDFVKALVAAVLTAIVAAIFKYIDPPTILTELWQRVFVGPWFLWLGAAGFGVYWLVRLLVKLHHDTTRTIPELLKANKELAEKELLAKTRSLEIFHTPSELSLEKEAKSRVAVRRSRSSVVVESSDALQNCDAAYSHVVRIPCFSGYSCQSSR